MAALMIRMWRSWIEHEDAGAGVGSADADVVQASGDAQGDDAGLVDAVGADPVVGVGAGCGVGFGSGGVGGGGGGLMGQGAVWAAVVVVLDEGVELGLQLGDGGGAGLVGEPFFEGLVESLDLAAGGGVVGGGVDLGDSEAAQFVFEAVASAFAAGEPGGEDHAVVGQRRGRNTVGGNGFAELGQHDGSGDAAVGGDRERVAGVVVDPVEDLHVGAIGRATSG